ncbi:MAG TPA: CAP domain-containing protein [Steroidobacteraceae bacterium]|nr:CAP domain-containing protein [Steroidobacteraceae bacterium]
MKCLSLRPLGRLVLVACGLATCSAWADPMSAVQLLRTSGCGGIMPAVVPLKHNLQLDRAAAAWASGQPVALAAGRSGYQARNTVGLRLRGADDAILQSLRQARCHMVADQSLQDAGVYRRGAQTWLVMATPNADSTANPAPLPPAARVRVLQLVNEVRASGIRCGDKSFGAAPPLQLSATLDGVAATHAGDMARHDYFEHVDLAGHSPADRLRATGYRERLVGENIAYGPKSAEEVVAGWLHSPGHCENIMDPRFVEMGLALAPGRGTRRGLYWDQEFAQPAP